MKKITIIVISLLLVAISLIGYTYWISSVAIQNLEKSEDAWSIDNWRPARTITYVDLESNQMLHQDKLKWQQPIPDYRDLGDRIWFLNPENPEVFNYEMMPNYDLIIYGYRLHYESESMGTSHGFLIDANGRLWTWGSNVNGRTGRGIITGNTIVPTLVDTGDTTFIQVSASSNYTIAIDSEGKLWSWGDSSNGRLGLGFMSGNVTIPTLVDTGDTRFINVSASGTNNTTVAHNLAVDTNGRIWSWGHNQFGQTGLGISSGATWTPRLIQGVSTRFVKVKAAHLHSLAVDTQGKLWSWGSHEHGATGLDREDNFSTVPQLAKSQLVTPVAISAANRHNIVLDSQGVLWGWGENLNGQTGLGLTSGNTSLPTKIETGANRFIDVSTSNRGSAAIDSEGNLWTWGTNEFGLNGNGTTTGHVLRPAKIEVDGVRFIRVFSASNGVIAIDTQGRLWGWGSNSTSRIGLGVAAGPYLTPTLNSVIIPIL